MDIIIIAQVYLAFVLLIYLHELGHKPKRIMFRWGIIPTAAAMQADSRIGGLVVNAVIAISIAVLKPEILFFQILGLVAWIHLIVYLILGAFLPEKKPSHVDIKTYIFDDVDNNKWLIAIIFAAFMFFGFNNFYMPILVNLW